MSSGKTELLQLHQWAPGDSFLREEFNEDNQKLDEAFAGPRYVKLLDVTTQTAASQMDLDVSGICFPDYWKVELYLDVALSTTGLTLRTNRLAAGYGTPPENGSSNSTGSQLAVFQRPANPSFYQLGTPRAGVRVSGRDAYFYCTAYNTYDSYTGSYINGMAPVTWDELETLNFVCGASIPAGSRFLLPGVKV